MSKIFERLAEQAVDGLDNTDMDVEEGMRLFIDKFGKEIIKECIGVIDNGNFLHDDSPAKHWATQVSKAIKRHFEMSKNG
jgi:hypothetical protein